MLIKFLVVKSLINIIETTGGLILVKVIGKYLILLLIAVLVLSACGKGKQDENSKDLSKTETSNHKGGELNVGLNAAPSGTLSSVLSSDA